MTKASIIIPCYNDGIYIIEALESILNYKGKYSIEIIIVNDGSTDKYTKDLLISLKEKGYNVINKPNGGLGSARNEGIRKANGEYVLPLDADNKICHGYIDEGVKILDNNPEIDIVYADATFFGEKSGKWTVGHFEVEKLFRANFIDACAIYRKKVWQNLNGYDENMPAMGSEDWDFWMRAFINGWNFCYLPKVLFEYRVRKDSMLHTETWPNGKKITEYIFNKPEYRLAKNYRHAILELKRYDNVKYLTKVLGRKIWQEVNPKIRINS
ncbi:MAG: glycosyltransferase [Bacteroidota bacterium]